MPACPATPIPVHVLTGFLGSGKSTLLNRMIRDPALVNSAVVVNEFGDIGVDHLLVSGGDGAGGEATLMLLGGCLCCELRDGLALTLADLLARRQRGQCLAFERIIIETTGLADPTPILNLLATDPLLAELTTAGAVLTVVDALNAADTLARYPQAVTQVVLADQIVISKSELAAARGSAAALLPQLRALNPRARVHDSGVAESASLSSLLARAPDLALAHPDSAGSEAEHPHLHAADIHTFTVRRETPLPGAALTLFVQSLVAQLGADLLRVKGVVHVAEAADRPMLLQGAQRVFHPLLPFDALGPEPQPEPGPAQQSRLVFIVRSASIRSLRAFVEQLLDALIWETTDISARLLQSESLLQSVPPAPAGAQAKEGASCSI